MNDGVIGIEILHNKVTNIMFSKWRVKAPSGLDSMKYPEIWQLPEKGEITYLVTDDTALSELQGIFIAEGIIAESPELVELSAQQKSWLLASGLKNRSDVESKLADQEAISGLTTVADVRDYLLQKNSI